MSNKEKSKAFHIRHILSMTMITKESDIATFIQVGVLWIFFGRGGLGLSHPWPILDHV